MKIKRTDGNPDNVFAKILPKISLEALLAHRRALIKLRNFSEWQTEGCNHQLKLVNMQIENHTDYRECEPMACCVNATSAPDIFPSNMGETVRGVGPRVKIKKARRHRSVKGGVRK